MLMKVLCSLQNITLSMLSPSSQNKLYQYHNNQYCSLVYQVLDQRRLFCHTKEKFRNTKGSCVFIIFLECVKIISVGVKHNRPQLQYWLLLLEHNTFQKQNSDVVAGLSVTLSYDCVYASACGSSSPFDFE